MVNIEDRIRKEVRYYPKGGKEIGYIHECKGCKSEIFLIPFREKTSTGYCRKCFVNYNLKKERIISGSRVCKSCNKELDVSLFYRPESMHNEICTKCRHLKKYGINSLEYDSISALQNNVCAICNSPETAKDHKTGKIKMLAVDHCHKTGKVRGLLCTRCNTSIGKLKDKIEYLESAIAYLKRT